MTTKTRIVRIGNSRGIRGPRILLDQAQLPDEVELCAEPGWLVGQRPALPALNGPGEGEVPALSPGPPKRWEFAIRRELARPADAMRSLARRTAWDATTRVVKLAAA
jgi:hypothetical protein